MDKFHLKDIDVFNALKNGKRTKEEKCKYRVIWNKWTIIVGLGNCCLIMITAWRD